MEYFQINLMLKCKTRKMGCNMHRKHKIMTVQSSQFEQDDDDEDDAQKWGQRTLFK